MTGTRLSLVMWKLSAGRPLTSRFTYDRNPLFAKRDADLKAEAAAIARGEAAQRLGNEVRQAPAQSNTLAQAFFPSILSPARGQTFIAQNIIPIKLAPPNGWKVTSYLLNVLINGYSCNLPVGAAQAQSAARYTDFGGGKPPCFLAIPGSYRLRAQTSSPTQSGWTDWVDFSVLPPRVSTPAGVGGILKK